MKKKISLVNLVKQEMKVTLGGTPCYIPDDDPEGGGGGACPCACNCMSYIPSYENVLYQKYPTPA